MDVLKEKGCVTMRKLLCIILLVCLFASPGLAGTQAGDIEVGGNLMVMVPSEGDTIVMAMGACGIFLFSQFELKGVGLIMNSGDGSTGYIGGGFDLYLRTVDYTVPYLGANVLTAIGDEYGDGSLIDLHGGIKQFVGENVSVNYSLTYTAPTDDFGEGYILGMIGLSFYL